MQFVPVKTSLCRLPLLQRVWWKDPLQCVFHFSVFFSSAARSNACFTR